MERRSVDSKEIFNALATPLFWEHKAKQLKRVYEILLAVVDDDLEKMSQDIKEKGDFVPFPFIADECMFMAGASIENLLKGLIAVNNPEYITKNGRVVCKTHNLTTLAQFAKLDLTNLEWKYLEKAYDYISIWGKYSIPLSDKEMDKRHNKLPRDFQNVYNSLFFKIESEIYNRCKAKSKVKV